MKRVLAILLFIMAIIVGLSVPELWLNGQDSSLGEVQTIDLSEPTLHWTDDKSATVESQISAEEIARKLELFATGPTFLLPQNTSPDADSSWVYTKVTTFLNALFEVEPVIIWFTVDYLYTWFDNGTTIPIWSVEMVLNEMWYCSIDIDEASGIILRCSIQSNGLLWEELFPNSFADINHTGSISAFQELVSFRFCEALNTVYEMNSDKTMDISAFPIPDQSCISLSITDYQTTEVTVSLIVYPEESIMFNHGHTVAEAEVAE